MSKAIFKELDRVVSAVLNKHFDLYFDEEEATKTLQEWWKSRAVRMKDHDR
jgi:hypothetical protein